MTDKVREALELEKSRLNPPEVAPAAFTPERNVPLQSSDDVSFLDRRIEFISARLEYLLHKSLERIERRRSTPEGRASVERENEQALKNYLDRPISGKPFIEPSIKSDIQGEIRSLSERFLAEQSLISKPQNGRER
jgi:hypothetical protein